MKSVLVTGDWVFDHHIYEGRRRHYADARSPGVVVRKVPGGAALIHQLLRQDDEKDGAERGALLPSGWSSHQAARVPDRSDEHQMAYAFWRVRPGAKGLTYWRVSEGMGFGPAPAAGPCGAWIPAGKLPEPPAILVVSDGGMGFRTSEACWTDLAFKEAKWVVYKTELPDFGGALWRRLNESRGKLVVIVSASELRRSETRISSGLSWEATLQDLYRELSDGSLKPLADGCAHLVVSFDTEGALWLDLSAGSTEGRKGKAHFLFDAPSIEGERRREIDSGAKAYGLSSCLAAGVVWGLTEALDASSPPVLWDGIEGGLSAMRDLLERGHGQTGRDACLPAGFPAKRLGEVIRSPRHLFSRATFAWDAAVEEPRWNLLQNASPDLMSRARLAAIHGDVALENVPHLRIGKLFTSDRGEIEGLRTLVRTIERFQAVDESADKKIPKPLSIGVFGPPGSGKSFAVKELAERYFHKDSWLVFNLSQFKDEADLVGAFHQIRDRALLGFVPVAFFDEFDSQNLRWLQYLLAPMQDGTFQEGPITHPIGKCVFVFAGGTSYTYLTFTPAHGGAQESEAERHFRLVKGPDFSSRLDAVLEVSGPNRRFKEAEEAEPFDRERHVRVGTHRMVPDDDDHSFGIRRARAIRHELGIQPGERLEIAPGMLDALLSIESYRHGSRSMEKILQALRSCRPHRICPSALPPKAQLGMHAKAEKFLPMLGKPSTDSSLPPGFVPAGDVVASGIHEAYRALGRRRGWLKNELDLPLEKLKELTGADDPTFSSDQVLGWFKESNREAAKRMVSHLEVVGLVLDNRRESDGPAAAEALARLESLLELLARLEHDGWMEWHFRHGWRFDKERNNTNKRHPLLIPYAELEDHDKVKDRSQVRQFPLFAALSGLQIVPRRAL